MKIPQLRGVEEIVELKAEVAQLKSATQAVQQVTNLLVGMVNFLKLEIEKADFKEMRGHADLIVSQISNIHTRLAELDNGGKVYTKSNQKTRGFASKAWRKIWGKDTSS